jgi:hypothetical protein
LWERVEKNIDQESQMQRWEKMANEQVYRVSDHNRIERELMFIGIGFGRRVDWKIPLVVEMGENEYEFITPTSPNELYVDDNYEFLPTEWFFRRIEYEYDEYAKETIKFNYKLTPDERVNLYNYLTEEVGDDES